MPLVTRTIAFGEQSDDVTAIQKGLLSLGADIAAGELFTASEAGLFESDTIKELQEVIKRFAGLDTLGEPFNASWGRMLHIAVAADAGNSAALQTAVKECLAVINASPAPSATELSWLARYAIIAHDFTTASKFIDLMSNPNPELRMVTDSTLQASEPELVNPENYYTFVYDYVPRKNIERWAVGFDD